MNYTISRKLSKDSIAFVGYRATGKTTVGRIVAQRLGWIFVDMDETLMDRLGMTIAEWVRDKGWESFRAEESRLLAEVASSKHVVVATGGGVVEKLENRQILKNNFFVIWLSCPAEEIVDRLAKDEKSISNRPSLTGLGLLEEVSQVLSHREPLYREVADVVIDVHSKKPNEVCDLIVNIFQCTTNLERSLDR